MSYIVKTHAGTYLSFVEATGARMVDTVEQASQFESLTQAARFAVDLEVDVAAIEAVVHPFAAAPGAERENRETAPLDERHSEVIARATAVHGPIVHSTIGTAYRGGGRTRPFQTRTIQFADGMQVGVDWFDLYARLLKDGPDSEIQSEWLNRWSQQHPPVSV